MKKLLNIEYGTIHGFYWMIYGIISSFASVYLLDRGYSNSEIGMIMAVANVLAVFMQPILADVADRSRRFTLEKLIGIITVCTMACAVFLFFIKDASAGLFMIYVLLLAFHTVLQPLINSMNFKLEESGVHINFGMCRCGGSLAYSVACAFLGVFVEKHGPNIIPMSGEVVMALLLISIFVTMKTFGKIIVQNGRRQVKLREYQEITLIEFVRKNKIFMVLNIGVFFLFINNQVLNNFMLQIVQNVGGNSKDMGEIFSLMAFLEIPTLFCFDWINRKVSCEILLKVASVGFLLKIGTVFMASSVKMIFFAHLLQPVSFALFLPAMVKYIDEVMERGEAVKGQSLYTTMVTVSAVAASLGGGVILDMRGATSLTLSSTIAAGIGAAIIFFSVDKVSKANI